jgi:tRNA nucleotidyltransferase (CCA-adding enzyme)
MSGVVKMLSLTPSESTVFHLIKQHCLKQNPIPTVRVAGGWVRDKLLHQYAIPVPQPDHKVDESSQAGDIDLAVDLMSGEEFAQSLGVKFTVNPGQSKHLASAVLHFDDPPLKVDVNRLRKETYNDISRIPETIEPGTEFDDVKRRDFTVNALYYNLISEKIEDFLECGLSDLQNKRLRTPKDAIESFTEDPLRIFRAVRFAARFDFNLDAELVQAIFKTKSHILDKVSRERIAQEMFQALLEGPDLACALRTAKLLESLDLFSLVFEPKLVLDDGKQLQVFPEEYLWSAERIQESISHLERVTLRLQNSSPASRVFLLSAILWPTRLFSYEPKKNKLGPLCEAILQHNCKQPVKLFAEVVRVLGSAQEFQKLFETDDVKASSYEAQIEYFGKILCDCKDDWIYAYHVAACAQGQPLNQEHLEHMYHWICMESGLDKVWEWKPYFSGKELSEALKLKGPKLGEAVKAQWSWRFQNPSGSKEDCLAYLLNRFSQ